jgi:hypothetical protein
LSSFFFGLDWTTKTEDVAEQGIQNWPRKEGPSHIGSCRIIRADCFSLLINFGEINEE